MTQQYIHAHQILKTQLWNYLITRIWFWIGLDLIAWWQTPANFRLCFLDQILIIAKLHTFMIENKRVKSRSEVKLLGITRDDKLSFTTHIENLCRTASNRLRALARIHKVTTFQQAKLLSEVCFMSTFAYGPLIWMYCGKTANYLINKIHKRSLSVIYEM